MLNKFSTTVKRINFLHLLLILLTGLFVFIALETVVTSHQWVITKDQWRIYNGYLQADGLIDAIFHAQNAHRPIFPGIAFWIDLNFFNAENSFVMIFGLTWLFATLLFLVRTADDSLGNNRELTLLVALVCCLFLFSLNSGHHFIIPNNIAKTYLLLFFYLTGIYCAYDLSGMTLSQGSTAGRLTRLLFVAICGMVATFSFSPGASYWIALPMVLLFFGRSNWKNVVFVAVFAVLSLLFYFKTGGGTSNSEFVLSVRENLNGFISIVAQFPYTLLNKSGQALVDGAGLRMAFSAIFAGTALGLMGLFLLRARKEENVSRLLFVAFGLILLGFGAASMISLGRIRFFPDIKFWPRYAIWSYFLWLGLFLAAVDLFHRQRKWLTLAVFILLLVLLTPSQIRWSNKYSLIIRKHYTAAASIVVKRPADSLISTFLYRGEEIIDRVDSEYRKLGLNYYSWPETNLVGTLYPTANLVTAKCRPVLLTQVEHASPQGPGSTFNIRVMSGALPPAVVLLDDDNRVVGFGQRAPRRLSNRNRYLVGAIRGSASIHDLTIVDPESQTSLCFDSFAQKTEEP